MYFQFHFIRQKKPNNTFLFSPLLSTRSHLAKQFQFVTGTTVTTETVTLVIQFFAHYLTSVNLNDHICLTLQNVKSIVEMFAHDLAYSIHKAELANKEFRLKIGHIVR